MRGPDIRKSVPTNYGGLAALFHSSWSQQVERLRSQFGEAVLEVLMPGDAPVEVPVVTVAPHILPAALQLLKSAEGGSYGFLADLTATDEYPETPRFRVVYNLYSPENKSRFRIKGRLSEGETCPSVVPIWPAADWLEREVWDMFGIRFEGHPDLRRILMDSRWEGHPLRKDYPLRGYQSFTEPQEIDESALRLYPKAQASAQEEHGK